ncbi:hypothetical protein DV737_g3444, partial [Chaetothyriales sp. CBS 132003]
MRIHKASWETRAAEKRASTLCKIPPEWRLGSEALERAKKQRDLTGPFIQHYLDSDDITIISKESVEITDAIRQGTLTAVAVATAFCKAAAIAHQINNCLHEIFFDQALERARYLDAYYADNKSTIGPLHGLPVSLKDQFHVKGIDTTMGYVGWIGSNMGIRDPSQVHQVESQITTELLSLGAVLYCKTSLPQTLLFGETKNNIIGQTLNPCNQNLSCGGSSGGEGALQALRGSTLGLGTDIGGSVRIPAAFNGIFSLKPTPERISYREMANTNPGQNTYRSTVGFLSTSLGGLELMLRSILSTKPWLNDPSVVSIPFRQDIVDEYLSRAEPSGSKKPSGPPLKLGVLWSDGIVTFLKADGFHDIHAQLNLSGEPLISDLEESFQLRPPLGLLEYQDLTLQGLEYEAEYCAYWNSTAEDDGQIVDAVIMPVAPHAAVIPGKYYHTGKCDLGLVSILVANQMVLTALAAYTEVINLMNYSVVVIPVTKADKNLDRVDDSYQPLNAKDKLNWEAYDPDIYHGAPVGVQLVARKFEEEKIWAIAKIVTAALEKMKAETSVH